MKCELCGKEDAKEMRIAVDYRHSEIVLWCEDIGECRKRAEGDYEKSN